MFQRTTLKIMLKLNNNTTQKDLTPNWITLLAWFSSIGKWLTLAFIVANGQWKLAIGIVIFWYLLMSLVPIPYKHFLKLVDGN